MSSSKTREIYNAKQKLQEMQLTVHIKNFHLLMNESNKSQQSDSAISLINLPVSMKLRLN